MLNFDAPPMTRDDFTRLVESASLGETMSCQGTTAREDEALDAIVAAAPNVPPALIDAAWVAFHSR